MVWFREKLMINVLSCINIYAEHPSVVSVFSDKARKLQTTRSWNFLSLERNGVVHKSSLWKKARYGEDTIIGNLDTGNY